jgi:hypothetical protein
MITFKKIFNCLNNKYEMIIVLLNILFFMCIQVLFFKYLVSKEYDVILKEKFNIIKSFIFKDEDLKKKYDIFKDNYIEKNKDIVIKQQQTREEINMNLIFKYCIIPIIIALGLIIILYFLPLKSEWDRTNTIAILLILTIYIPELILYVLVFNKYQYVGNVDILTKIYSSSLT